MDALIGFWGYALAAATFAALLIWRVIDPARQPEQKIFLGALAMTACWAWLTAIDPTGGLARYSETARNLVWIGLLYSLSQSSDDRQHGVQMVYGAVAAAIGFQLITTYFNLTSPSETVRQTANLLRLTTAAGALVLVHNFYGQAAPDSRSPIRYAMLGLAAMWLYDVNLYTFRYLESSVAEPLMSWRGLAMTLTVPMFALSARRSGDWKIRLSRAATFQSISLLAICGYFGLMAVLATALRGSDVDWSSMVLIAILASMTLGLMVFLPSASARAWLKVKLAKHLFEHRYDYRAEWLRFADALGRGESDGPSLEQRIVRAFADVVDAPAGLLVQREAGADPAIAADWEWPDPRPSTDQIAELAPLWDGIEESGRVIAFPSLRNGKAETIDAALNVPHWALGDEWLWAAVPLIHHERLVAMVLLAPPGFNRPLDWEDFDLLRTAGRQAASALAEAQGQAALANAQRFEEFNRRFAFILHDIKNLVSQLSLVARNAERHADNPEFRADMVATLQSSVSKMNDLLARLAPRDGGRHQPPRAVPLGPIIDAALGARGASQRVERHIAGDLWVEADPDGLEQALGHLVQNAIEASGPQGQVTIEAVLHRFSIRLSVVDTGCGMDGEFIRNRLFQPFASTKDGGFGVGAFEARSLVNAMGGRLDVESRPGKGARFTIILPAAEPQGVEDRKSA